MDSHLFALAIGLKPSSIRWFGFVLVFSLFGTRLNLLSALESMLLIQEGLSQVAKPAIYPVDDVGRDHPGRGRSVKRRFAIDWHFCPSNAVVADAHVRCLLQVSKCRVLRPLPNALHQHRCHLAR